MSGKKWIRGEVLQRLDSRQYEVKREDGAIIVRNRKHLRPDSSAKSKPNYSGMELTYDKNSN